MQNRASKIIIRTIRFTLLTRNREQNSRQTIQLLQFESMIIIMTIIIITFKTTIVEEVKSNNCLKRLFQSPTSSDRTGDITAIHR